jgi:hypothetical protein
MVRQFADASKTAQNSTLIELLHYMRRDSLAHKDLPPNTPTSPPTSTRL